MAQNGSDATYGYPKFPVTDAPEIGVDEEIVAAYARWRGNRIVDTAAARTTFTSAGYAYNGLEWYDSDTDRLWRHNGTDWKLQEAYAWLHQAADQNVSDNLATVMDFPTGSTSHVFGGMVYDAGTDSITVPVTGIYSIFLTAEWVTNTTGRREIGPYVNGVSVGAARVRLADIGAPSGRFPQHGSWDLPLNGGDVVTAFLFQASGGTLACGNRRMRVELKKAT